jgi:hypothetical protein
MRPVAPSMCLAPSMCQVATEIDPVATDINLVAIDISLVAIDISLVAIDIDPVASVVNLVKEALKRSGWKGDLSLRNVMVVAAGSLRASHNLTLYNAIRWGLEIIDSIHAPEHSPSTVW